MRISDWSSDVCSSDLMAVDIATNRHQGVAMGQQVTGQDFGHGERLVCRRGLSARTALRRASGKTPENNKIEEHTSELQSLMRNLVCRLLLAKKNKIKTITRKQNHLKQ